MITSGNEIRVYDNSLAKDKSFFTGGLNLQKLEFDPLITGYAFIIWVKVPKWVEDAYPGFKAMTQKNFKAFDGLADIELETAQYQYGFGNGEYNVAGGIQKQNTEFTLKHEEYSGSPIKNMYQYWVSGIRDPETDIATYARKAGVEYAAKNHTGSLLYIVMRPDVNNIDKKNIEFAAYYTNVFPTRIPLGHLNYQQGDHNQVEIDIPFKGNMHISPKIDNYARKLLKSSAYSFVTEDMFDPEKSDIAGETISDYTPGSGITGSNLGDI